jgi:hypothetical protein
MSLAFIHSFILSLSAFLYFQQKTNSCFPLPPSVMWPNAGGGILFLSLSPLPPLLCYGTADTVSQIFEVHFWVWSLVIDCDLILCYIHTCKYFNHINWNYKVTGGPFFDFDEKVNSYLSSQFWSNIRASSNKWDVTYISLAPGIPGDIKVKHCVTMSSP